MKTTNRILLLAAAAAAAFTLNASVSGAESASPARVPTNQALAASPRYLEEHPELPRTPPSAEAAQAKAARIRKQLAKLMANRAWAASPQVREEFPRLTRGGVAP